MSLSINQNNHAPITINCDNLVAIQTSRPLRPLTSRWIFSPWIHPGNPAPVQKLRRSCPSPSFKIIIPLSYWTVTITPPITSTKTTMRVNINRYNHALLWLTMTVYAPVQNLSPLCPSASIRISTPPWNHPGNPAPVQELRNISVYSTKVYCGVSNLKSDTYISSVSGSPIF